RTTGAKRKATCGQAVNLPTCKRAKIGCALKNGIFLKHPALFQFSAQAKARKAHSFGRKIGELVGLVENLKIEQRRARLPLFDDIDLHGTVEQVTRWKEIHFGRAITFAPKRVTFIEPDAAILVIVQFSPFSRHGGCRDVET